MPRRVDIVLEEILVAIAEIEKATRSETAASFETNWLLQRGIERGLEIVSEAVRHLPVEIRAKRPDIPWRSIRALGNLLRHEYFRVEAPVIWSVIQHDLPALKEAVEALIADGDA